MSNVISMTDRRPERSDCIWRCDCGGLTHYAHENGDLECAACATVQIGCGGWRKNLPSEQVSPPMKGEELSRRVENIGDPKWALQRVLGAASVDKTEVVIIVQSDGALKVWGGENVSDEGGDKRLSQALAEVRDLISLVNRG